MSVIKEKKQGRMFSLDFIRFIAIACVVLNHSVELCYRTYKYEVAVAINTLDHRSVIVLLFSIGRLGVPLFLMLTGYLLLHRDYDKKGSLKRFWIHNLLSLVVTWQIWLLFYNLLFSFLEHKPFDTASWVRQMLFVKDNDFSHSWYIPMVIGIYIFIPFIAKGLKDLRISVVVFIIVISYAAFFIVPSVNEFFGAYGIENISLKALPAFTGVAYAAYMTMGHLFYVIDKRLQEKKRAANAEFIIIVTECIIGAGSMFLTVLLQLQLHKESSQYMLWYTFFTVPWMSVCLFALLRRVNKFVLTGFIRRVSICSFGMYLVHFPLQMIMIEKHTFFNDITAGLSGKYVMLIIFAVSFFASYGISEGIAHIPFAGDLLVKVKSKRFNVF